MVWRSDRSEENRFSGLAAKPERIFNRDILISSGSSIFSVSRHRLGSRKSRFAFGQSKRLAILTSYFSLFLSLFPARLSTFPSSLIDISETFPVIFRRIRLKYIFIGNKPTTISRFGACSTNTFVTIVSRETYTVRSWRI